MVFTEKIIEELLADKAISWLADILNRKTSIVFARYMLELMYNNKYMEYKLTE